MVWFKVDDGLAFHHKALIAGNAALGLWVRAGAWCGQHETDGHVPSKVAETLGTPAQAARLVKAGLWVETDHGYLFHDWSIWNPTSAQLEASRKKTAKKVQNFREKRRKKNADILETRRSEGQVTGNATGSEPGYPGSGSVVDISTGRTVVAVRESATSSQNSQQRGTRLPEPFPVTAEMVAWARANCPHVDGRYETDKFCDYWRGKTGASATKKDWEGTWRNWLRRAEETIAANGHRKSTTDDRVTQALLLE
jgi:hypothetical protein